MMFNNCPYWRMIRNQNCFCIFIPAEFAWSTWAIETNRRPVGTAHLEQGLAAPGQVILHGISRVRFVDSRVNIVFTYTLFKTGRSRNVPFLVCFSHPQSVIAHISPHFKCRISINQPTPYPQFPCCHRSHLTKRFHVGLPTPRLFRFRCFLRDCSILSCSSTSVYGGDPGGNDSIITAGAEDG